MMTFSLAGLWQLSPLTDFSIPLDDICLPGPLSQNLNNELSEEVIAKQEWHLMHDIELADNSLSYSAIDFVLEGVDFNAEIRLNGFALFDCDQQQSVYKKNVLPFLQRGRNRFEILFLHKEEDDCLLENEAPPYDEICFLEQPPYRFYDHRIGIWKEPYLQCLHHIRLTSITTEQIWHHGGGCEVLIHLHFDLLKPGLVSAKIKFDGRIYSVPLDMTKREVTALFQVDAPVTCDNVDGCSDCLYPINIDVDGIHQEIMLRLSSISQISHFLV